MNGRPDRNAGEGTQGQKAMRGVATAPGRLRTVATSEPIQQGPRCSHNGLGIKTGEALADFRACAACPPNAKYRHEITRICPIHPQAYQTHDPGAAPRVFDEAQRGSGQGCLEARERRAEAAQGFGAAMEEAPHTVIPALMPLLCRS